MLQVKEGSLASQSASPRNVVVVGGGVIGLTTALVLSRDHSHCVTLVAKHLPGDSSQYYTSPWAGANFLPFSAAGTKEHRWERDTWPALAALATDCPETGIHFQDTILYTRRKDCVDATASVQCELHSPEPWFKDLLPNFRIDYPTVADSPDVMFTTHFTSVCINPVLYLPWLLGQCLRHGVQVKRASLNHILDAVKLHHTGLTADVVINCTGLGAAQLDGVRDTTVVPVRGQTILVNSDPGCMIGVSGSDEGTEELTYVMKRAGGGGTVLGGSYHRALDKSEADPDLAARILRRCVSYCPQLTQKLQEQGTLDFLSHRIGFRPCRTAGPRVEQERLGNINIVHNYGHGGFGYQTSYACAYDVAKMVHAMAASTPLAKL